MSNLLDILLLIIICANCYLSYKNLQFEKKDSVERKALMDSMQAKIAELEAEAKKLKAEVSGPDIEAEETVTEPEVIETSEEIVEETVETAITEEK